MIRFSLKIEQHIEKLTHCLERRLLVPVTVKLDWVLSHWAHFAVHIFMGVYMFVFYVVYCIYFVLL